MYVVDKPTKLAKDDVVRMRIPAEHKQKMIEAAEADGLDLSAWLRRLALREVGLLPKLSRAARRAT